MDSKDIFLPVILLWKSSMGSFLLAVQGAIPASQEHLTAEGVGLEPCTEMSLLAPQALWVLSFGPGQRTLLWPDLPTCLPGRNWAPHPTSFLRNFPSRCFYSFSLTSDQWWVGFPGGASGKEPACQCRRYKRHRFDLWVGKIPRRRRAWQPSQVFLPGESHGEGSLVGYSPYGRKESDTTEMTEYLIPSFPYY